MSKRVLVLWCTGWMLASAAGAQSASPGARSGAEVYRAECAACHGDKGDGVSDASRLLPVPPRNFTRKRFKLRSTASGEMPTRQDLFDTVTRGIRVRAMPAFDFLPEGERWAVVDEVIRMAGAPAGTTAVPLPPEPGEVDAARGKAAYEKIGCGKCHLPNEEGVSPPPLKDESGADVTPPHLLYSEYLGGDGKADVVRRLTVGMDGAPMPSFAGTIGGEDMWALASWLKADREPVPHTEELKRIGDPLMRASKLVERYRCNACHVIGNNGGTVGPSLDTAGTKLRVEWLRAWLTDPRALGKFLVDRPYRMPHLKLTKGEVEDLVRLILARGGRSPGDPAPVPAETDAKKVAAGETMYRIMCTKCHALGSVIPATVPEPKGPDLLRMRERLHFPWLQAAIISEGCNPEQAIEVRDFLWKVCTEKGPKPPEAK